MTRGAAARARSAAAVVARSVGGDPAERRRRRLLGAALTCCAAFLLAAVAVATFGLAGPECLRTPGGSTVCVDSGGGYTVTSPPGVSEPIDDFSFGGRLVPDTSGLAPYVGESGLRPGVVVAALLLVVPFAVFALQVVRLGSAARERRLAALRLQGATSADLRRIAAAEVRGTGLVAGVAGLPAYLGLWLLLGVLPPSGWRLLPTPAAALVVGWPVVAVLVVVAAVLAARRAADVGTVDALGLSRRRARPLSRSSATTTAVILGVLVLGLVLLFLAPNGAAAGVVVLVLPLVFVAAAVAAGPWIVVAVGRRHVRRGNPVAVLAGRRLIADPRTPGRVAGVLLAVGLAVGFAVSDVIGIFLSGRTDPYDLAFFGGGILTALAAIGLAAVVAALSLVVGASEQVLDARRPTAALVALGAEPATVVRVVRTQLRSVSVLPAVGGAVVGATLLGGWFAVAEGGGRAWVVPAALGAVVVAVLVAGGAAALGAAGAQRLLRRPLAEAMSVESLRTA
ncbi:hypothetical protein [Kineosporia sp. A_224]|uniref:hypothetical protein n=1 Tax=Kineosporia sp. A_224 TaxID=1962180 RepID=UPI000B4AA7E1|nr:hypothetical protein [Kineosporia sp. A_224]